MMKKKIMIKKRVELVLKIWWYSGIFSKDVVAPKRAVGFLKNFSV